MNSHARAHRRLAAVQLVSIAARIHHLRITQRPVKKLSEGDDDLRTRLRALAVIVAAEAEHLGATALPPCEP